MTNIKKIGLTALAASLVSTSAFAADIKVKGGASLGVSSLTGEGVNQRPAYTMGNQITFSGSGELENGLKVSVSFQADQDAADGASSPFDDHSITLSSASAGSLKFWGHGGKTVTETIGSTVSGAIWDDYDGLGGTGPGTAGTDLLEATADNNSFLYTSPEFVAGLNALISVNPGGTTSSNETEFGYGATFKGVEGLTLGYADAAVKVKNTPAKTGDHKVYKATYVFGPITAGYARSDFEVGTGAGSSITVTDASDDSQIATSMSLGYSINENLSVSYGTENLEGGATSDEDAKLYRFSTAYTDGGMTFSSEYSDAKNMGYTTYGDEDMKYFELGLAFNF